MKRKIEAILRLFLLLFVAGALMRPLLARATAPLLDLSLMDSTVSADVDDRPLGEVLRVMAEKGLIEIGGGARGEEPLSVHFRGLTLDQALSRIMRGYNYVVIEQGKARAPLLRVMGKIERAKIEASKPSGAPPPPPAAVAADSSSDVPQQPPQSPTLPVGKDGRTLPHWTDDEGQVHIIGEPEASRTAQATGEGQKQENEQQQGKGASEHPSDSGSTGASANKQVSDPAPEGRKQESPRETATGTPDQPLPPESPGVRF